MITKFNFFEARFYEPEYSVVMHTGEEFDNVIQFKKQKLSKRIRFFNYHLKIDDIYFTLYADGLIIGINKLMKVKDGRYDGSDYVVAYFSIDRDFRDKKLSRLLYDTMFSWLKENNYSIASTEWSVPGRKKLRHIKHELGKEYGVKTIDRDGTHDIETMYNDDLVHYDEMTDGEKKEFDKGRDKHKFSFLRNLGN